MKTKQDQIPVRSARCDIRRQDDSIVMRLEMPGVGKEGLDINVEGDRLSIRGRRAAETAEGNVLLREIRPGDYAMEYTIDGTIDRKAIQASLEQGVLTLVLGLSEEIKPRKIAIAAK